jgi:hypothetical protein
MHSLVYTYICICNHMYIDTYEYIYNHIGDQGNGSRWGYRHNDSIRVYMFMYMYTYAYMYSLVYIYICTHLHIYIYV